MSTTKFEPVASFFLATVIASADVVNACARKAKTGVQWLASAVDASVSKVDCLYQASALSLKAYEFKVALAGAAKPAANNLFNRVSVMTDLIDAASVISSVQSFFSPKKPAEAPYIFAPAAALSSLALAAASSLYWVRSLSGNVSNVASLFGRTRLLGRIGQADALKSLKVGAIFYYALSGADAMHRICKNDANGWKNSLKLAGACFSIAGTSASLLQASPLLTASFGLIAKSAGYAKELSTAMEDRKA